MRKRLRERVSVCDRRCAWLNYKLQSCQGSGWKGLEKGQELGVNEDRVLLSVDKKMVVWRQYAQLVCQRAPC